MKNVERVVRRLGEGITTIDDIWEQNIQATVKVYERLYCQEFDWIRDTMVTFLVVPPEVRNKLIERIME